jgi:N-acetyl-anhydromuramyl-L-alanine amidase AmpD
VVNGIAAELPLAHRTRFKVKKIAKMQLKYKKIQFDFCRTKSYPGHATAVIRTFFFHFSPPNTTKEIDLSNIEPISVVTFIKTS